MGRARVDLSGVTAIGVDEMAWAKGHEYVTVAYQLDEERRRLLWIGGKRRAKTLLGFFRWFGKDRTANLRFTCSDMWKPYLKVIAKKAGHALHLLDRFHIAMHLSRAIDKVRVEEARLPTARGYEPMLKRTRWLLKKRPENLAAKQDAKLANLLRYNLSSVRAYLLKEDLQGLWDYAHQHPAHPTRGREGADAAVDAGDSVHWLLRQSRRLKEKTMADDLTRKRPEDPTKINSSQSWELQYWSKKFGVTIAELKRAIQAVGPMVADVRRHLRK